MCLVLVRVQEVCQSWRSRSAGLQRRPTCARAFGAQGQGGKARVERPWEALTVAWGDVRAAVLGSH